MKFDFQTIAIIAGGIAIIFWPVVSNAIKAYRASGGEPSPSPQPSNAPPRSAGPRDNYIHIDDCPCVEPQEAVVEKTKSEWVSECMAIRNYSTKRRLSKAVESCDVLISEIISGKPDSRPKLSPRRKEA